MASDDGTKRSGYVQRSAQATKDAETTITTMETPVAPGSESGTPALGPDTPLPARGNALDGLRTRVARRPRPHTPYGPHS
jgi:hypothetical protein